jgi:hypothetical protein
MSTCPISLLNVTNGVYYYQCVDCDNPLNASVEQSDHALNCGCDAGNSDCTADGGGGIGQTHHAVAAKVKPAKAKAKAAKKAARAEPVAPHGELHIVRQELAWNGLASALPADYAWQFSGATYDPDYEGANAYHVVMVDGRPRYIRVVRATITPPASLVHVSLDGKTPRLTHLPQVEVKFGQETEMPPKVKPRTMEIAGLTAGGPCYLKLKRAGARVDAPVFHVLLKK